MPNGLRTSNRHLSVDELPSVFIGFSPAVLQGLVRSWPEAPAEQGWINGPFPHAADVDGRVSPFRGRSSTAIGRVTKSEEQSPDLLLLTTFLDTGSRLTSDLYALGAGVATSATMRKKLNNFWVLSFS